MDQLLVLIAIISLLSLCLIVSFFWQQSRLLAMRNEVERLTAINGNYSQSELKLQSVIETKEEALARTRLDLAGLREQSAAREVQIRGLMERISDYKAQLSSVNERESALNRKLQETGIMRARLETELREKQIQYEQQLLQLDENRTLLKREFESLAQEILESKGRSFSELSQQNLQTLLTPMRTELSGFKDRIEKIHQVDAEQRVQLRTELQNLQQLNREITDQAASLTRALQGQKKLQGNWGELILENVLESSGLRRDIDYKREVSIDTDDGSMRPDVVIYLPEGKHLIIDAKTSLAAYTRFVNAQDDVTRLESLQEHAEAVRARIKELADKRYYKLNGLNSPEVVIMFIPIESAYVEALKHNASLFQEAIEQQILVATPITLLTSLNIVRQLWRFEDQSKNSALLADKAEKFYSKLNAFVSSMQDVGKKLEGAQQSYERALAQLYSGRGNLIKQASELKELGIAVQKELPEELVDKAMLEIDLIEPATEDKPN